MADVISPNLAKAAEVVRNRRVFRFVTVL